MWDETSVLCTTYGVLHDVLLHTFVLLFSCSDHIRTKHIPVNQSEIKHKLLSSGVATSCWSDARTVPAEFAARRVLHTDDEIRLMRYPSSGGQQSRLLKRPPQAGEADVVLTPAQWQALCEVADAT